MKYAFCNCKKEQSDVIVTVPYCPDCYPEAFYKELKAQKEAAERKAHFRKLLKEEFGI